MSESVPYVYVVVLAMVWRIMSSRKTFSFELFKDYEFKNTNCIYLEKFLMFLFPICIAIIYFLEMTDIMIIKLLLTSVILIDFLIQYLYKQMKWIVLNEEGLSKQFIWWIILIIVIFIIV